jgi:hypothetical protein
MSKVAITGNASGTGVFTIASPNSNTDRTLNLPDSAGTLATAESTLVQFNASGSAPVYACRAWVNFNGTGTVAIRASGNVSSITDLGTGNYQINFTTAMPDANYVVNVNGRCSTGTVGVLVANANSVAANATGSSQIAVGTSNDSGFDADFIFVSIFR